MEIVSVKKVPVWGRGLSEKELGTDFLCTVSECQ